MLACYSQVSFSRCSIPWHRVCIHYSVFLYHYSWSVISILLLIISHTCFNYIQKRYTRTASTLQVTNPQTFYQPRICYVSFFLLVFWLCMFTIHCKYPNCHLLIDVHLYKFFTCLDINKIRLSQTFQQPYYTDIRYSLLTASHICKTSYSHTSCLVHKRFSHLCYY